MAACPGEQLDRDPELGSLFFHRVGSFDVMIWTPTAAATWGGSLALDHV